MTQEELGEKNKDSEFDEFIEEQIQKDLRDDIPMISKQVHLPFVLTPDILEMIKSSGAQGWLSDDVITIFYSLLQEYVLIKNKNKEKTLPIVYLDTHTTVQCYPGSSEWRDVRVRDLFSQEWVSKKNNRNIYAEMYKYWYEEKTRSKGGNVFKILTELNEVSLLQYRNQQYIIVRLF